MSEYMYQGSDPELEPGGMETGVAGKREGKA